LHPVFFSGTSRLYYQQNMQLFSRYLLQFVLYPLSKLEVLLEGGLSVPTFSLLVLTVFQQKAGRPRLHLSTGLWKVPEQRYSLSPSYLYYMTL